MPQLQPKEEFFAKIVELLESIHYKVTKNDGQYIEAISQHKWSEEKGFALSAVGKRKIGINYDESMNLINFVIRDDYDTRHSYNGVIYHLDDIIWIEERTNSGVYYIPKEVRDVKG